MDSRPANKGFRGLFAAWLLVAIPSVLGFLAFFLHTRPDHHTVGQAVGQGLFWGGVIALIWGTLTYGVIRAGQVVATDDQTVIDQFLLGRDRRESKRWLVGVGVLSVLLFGGLAASRPEQLTGILQDAHVGIEVAVLIMGTLGLSVLATVHGYRNDGLLVGWALVFGPVFVYLAFAFVFPSEGGTSLVVGVLYVGVISTFPATAGGTVGTLLGSGLRRLRRWGMSAVQS